VYARMPAELQKLNQNRVAQTRTELYEAR
jgi:hypothetical protein